MDLQAERRLRTSSAVGVLRGVRGVRGVRGLVVVGSCGCSRGLGGGSGSGGSSRSLRAACQKNSIQQRGALNYGIVRSGGGQKGHTDAKQLTADKCQHPGSNSQKWSQPHGNGGPLVHTGTGLCITVSGALGDLDLAPCTSAQATWQNFTFGSAKGTGFVTGKYAAPRQNSRGCWDLQYYDVAAVRGPRPQSDYSFLCGHNECPAAS